MTLVCTLIVVSMKVSRIQDGLVLVGAAIVYLCAGFALHPAPDDDNLGWGGGLLDNPLRYSDNANRLLLLFYLLLLPGRFVAEALVDLVVTVRKH